jgi:oligoendopeptidase F
MARNAGQPDYRAYAWLVKKRFDYTPEMCLEFGTSCQQFVVPLVEELDGQAAHELRVRSLRPWDTAADPKGRPPLTPFAAGDTAGFVEKTRRMFQRLSPHFAGQFATMTLGDTLDLDSRKGKRPGGYQEWLPRSGTPFIFMNAVGSQGDVRTLLHEGGHAFNALEAAAYLDLGFLHHPPPEFAEVASMAMELLPADFYDEFYTPDDARRARRQALEHAIRILPWIATIDGFQHWIYTHPSHTREQRTACWLSLLDRFAGRGVDWSRLEAARAAIWQRQIHLFDFPFYYVEYGIAQLGALQLWLQYKKDPARAVANYRHALALGGSRPLPELFRAAGLSFDFSPAVLEPVVRAVREELAAIPA